MLQLDEQCVILEMKAGSKEEALLELAEVAHHRCDAIDIQTLVNVLKDRELVGSTGVGNGVAIPHGKIQGLEKLLLCFGRSRSGVDFDAIDNRPVYLFILILSPTGMAEGYLRTLARVSRLLKNPIERTRLLHADSVKEIVDIFQSVQDTQSPSSL